MSKQKAKAAAELIIGSILIIIFLAVTPG